MFREQTNPSHNLNVLSPRNLTVKNNMITILARLQNDEASKPKPLLNLRSPIPNRFERSVVKV